MSSVTVVNAPPVVQQRGTFEAYVSPTNKIPLENELYLCSNQDELVTTMELVVKDMNTIIDIEDDGNITYKLVFYDGIVFWDLAWFRGTYFLMTLVENTTYTGTYIGNFIFNETSEETGKTDTYYFYYIATDGDDYASVVLMNTTFYKGDCTYAWEKVSWSNKDINVFEEDETNVALLVEAEQEREGSIVIRRGLPLKGEIVQGTYSSGIIPTEDFIEIKSSEHLFENTTADIIIFYEEDGLPEDIYEDGLRIAKRSGSQWNILNDTTIDTKEGYVIAPFAGDGQYTLVSTPQPTAREGGGGSSCHPDWECGEWSECSDSKQTRTCENMNGCKLLVSKHSKFKKPSEERECEVGEIVVVEEKKTKDEEKKGKFLFDINADIIDDILFPGENLSVRIQLFNFGKEGIVEANVTTSIRDEWGSLVLYEQETVYVEAQKEYIREYGASMLKTGSYTIHFDLSYPDQEDPASAVEEFRIVEEQYSAVLALPVALLLSIIGYLLVVEYKKKHGKKSSKTKKPGITAPETPHTWY